MPQRKIWGYAQTRIKTKRREREYSIQLWTSLDALGEWVDVLVLSIQQMKTPVVTALYNSINFSVPTFGNPVSNRFVSLPVLTSGFETWIVRQRRVAADADDRIVSGVYGSCEWVKRIWGICGDYKLYPTGNVTTRITFSCLWPSNETSDGTRHARRVVDKTWVLQTNESTGIRYTYDS